MQVRLTAGTLPPNVCIDDLQSFYQLMFSNAYGTLDTTASIAKIIVGASEPKADQRDYIWIRLNPTTLVYDRTYNYVNGKWVSPYRVPVGSGERIFWASSTIDLSRYDGGSITTVGDATGPFWEPDTAMAAKIPIGAGTLGSGAILSTGVPGGNETVTIAKVNLPVDKLLVSLDIIGQGSVGTSGEPVIGNQYGSDTVSGSGKAVDSTSTDLSSRYKPKGQTEAMGSGTALNIMPPYYPGVWARRTARKYWTPS